MLEGTSEADGGCDSGVARICVRESSRELGGRKTNSCALAEFLSRVFIGNSFKNPEWRGDCVERFGDPVV